MRTHAIYVSQVVMNIKLWGNVVRGMNVSKGNLSEIMEGRRMGKRRCMRTSSPCIIQQRGAERVWKEKQRASIVSSEGSDCRGRKVTST